MAPHQSSAAYFVSFPPGFACVGGRGALSGRANVPPGLVEGLRVVGRHVGGPCFASSDMGSGVHDQLGRCGSSKVLPSLPMKPLEGIFV